VQFKWWTITRGKLLTCPLSDLENYAATLDESVASVAPA